MTARLFCKTGALAGSEYPIGEEATIGRREQNDITLPPDAVSERHARIFFDDAADCYVLEDLDSSNGTRIDDTEVIDPVPMKNLHIITFAEEVDFIFQAVTEGAVPSSAEEEAKTQFGIAPESPSTLPGEDEPEGERTRLGEAPGALPDLPDEESPPEKEGNAAEDEDRTRFGEAPPELPDLSEEGKSDKPDGDRTQMGQAPDALPDLPDENSPEQEERPSKEEDRTRFGESPPELPDLSEGPGGDESDDEEVEQTRMEADAPSLPDLSRSDPSSEEEEQETAPEPSSRYELHVTLKNGPEDTHSLPEGKLTIGRSPDCDIQIEDPGVSREHARLIVESDEVVLEDVGSKNFTFVDGDRLSEPTTLSPGSEIQFGLQAKAVLHRAST